jgi:hypothetical protein
MQQHEARFGPLDVSGGRDAAPGQPAAESSSEPKLRPVKR